MITNPDRLTEQGCSTEKQDKVCRSRGGESCAFDGAMIVLQPIADAAHIVHGPIACCGNSWEGRGTLSTQGDLHRRGFTTDMTALDVVYGSEEKLVRAVHETVQRVAPEAVFVYATCVSGLIGEDLDAVCRRCGADLGIPVIPVHAPGFVGPKNLGNRIAGEALLEHVIGTAEPEEVPRTAINLIGEYNISGDLWHVEPILREAGFSVLARMTGNASFGEITWAHRAKLNVVVCSRALINVAWEMERRYGIPFVEVSFYGKTEMAKALRALGSQLAAISPGLPDRIEGVIAMEEQKLQKRLKPYEHLRGRRAVLYTGGVKSWSFISALADLGIEVVAVGVKKSTAEDEEKIRGILGPEAPVVEDVAPANLKRLLRERGADILVAGGRNQYLAVKEGYPFVDVNQERHHAYAGYDGLVTLADQISRSMRFYEPKSTADRRLSGGRRSARRSGELRQKTGDCLIDPLKHSPGLGAVLALQGIDRCAPVLHGAQGCGFLGKVLLTKHFREPISLLSTKLFTEDVVLGAEEKMDAAVSTLIAKNKPDVVPVLTTALSEVKGDDIATAVKMLGSRYPETTILGVSTPDYAGGLEAGYAAAVEAVLSALLPEHRPSGAPAGRRINILAGPQLTPADCTEMREIAGAFGLEPLILPDLACLDGSRQGISPLAEGGIGRSGIRLMAEAGFTVAVGASMEGAAKVLHLRCGVDYAVVTSVNGLEPFDRLLQIFSLVSGQDIPERFLRQRRVLVDAYRDAHFFLAGARVCVALDPDHALQTTIWLTEAGATTDLLIAPTDSASLDEAIAQRVRIGGLDAVEGDFDLLISNSHAVGRAEALKIPLLVQGFPVWTVLGYPNRVVVGYRGTLSLIQEAATMVAKEVHG